MKTVLIFTTALIFVLLSACKEKQTPKKETSVQVVKTENTTPPKVEVEKPKDVKPVVKEKKHYFLVAGCFEYKSNADKLCQSLQKEGFSDAEVLNYFENLYLVTYEGYAQKTDALVALKNIQKEASKQKTWLYHVK
ncbi:SPOR domain-containing protein [uncultured Sanguibacteroides sp.]|uniref:SPOR domain-containing protein n=1 Tax=uncultured Sanguibacteroides sp. TaxID=1635151 RepID=UPI0025CF5D4B|nr:SPOR domain-containing protein [uncultured Sanguibacteroides sp.]